MKSSFAKNDAQRFKFQKKQRAGLTDKSYHRRESTR